MRGAVVKEWIEQGTLLTSQPGRLLLGWGERSWSSAPAIPSSKPWFYFPDFFLKAEKPWFTHAQACELSAQELLDHLSHLAMQNPSPIHWQNPNFGHFQKTFKDLQCKFKANELDKAVPYLFEHAAQRMAEAQLRASLTSLLNYSLQNPAHLYGFWDGTEGILGATPEILFKFIDAKRLETVACAGTMGDQRDASSFLADPKEQHEHQLVVQGIKEALSSFGKVQIQPVHLLRLSRLVHLVTPILVELESPTFTYVQVVNALHPTAAVGTFPKDKGAKWLSDYQSEMERGRFGAPCGALLPELSKSSCYVAIRNVQWSAAGMRIGAGCGVVAESVCAPEWAEIQLKLRAIKEMLAL